MASTKQIILKESIQRRPKDVAIPADVRTKGVLLATLGLALASILTGCATSYDPAKTVDLGPSPQVQYAIDKVSPAVVRLDIVSENFENGQSQTIRAIGSGAIIDQQGHILTNFHVAGRAKRIDITLANQEHVPATLVGSDHWTDLALVQLNMEEVHKKGLTFASAELGDSNKVKLGQPVMALGTPFGLTRTLTSGIISNTDRFFDEGNIDGYETGWFNNWIQMDAAINPGNSGGPLIDLSGKIIGINTRGNPKGNNLGFAIPSNVARKVIAGILAKGKVERSYIGIRMQPLLDFENYYDLSSNSGVLIGSIDPGSPAETAGLQSGDIIRSINDIPVTARFPEHLARIRQLIADVPVGSPIHLTITRKDGNSQKPVQVQMATEKLESQITEEKSIVAAGMSVRNLTRSYLREKRMPMMDGVLVTGVSNASASAKAGIRPQDIILRVHQKPVKNTDELSVAIAEWESGKKPVVVDIRRDRSEKQVILSPKE